MIEPPKPATGHAGAVRTIGAGHIDGGIELWHGNLIIVAQRIVRSVEQIAGRLDVTCGESIHELVHTADFGDDVTYTLLHGFIFQLAKHLRQCGIRIGRGGNGFGGNAQIGDARISAACSQVERRCAYWPSLS